jgi:hypothetical protein
VITALVLAGVFTPIRKALEGIDDRRFKPRVSHAQPAPAIGVGGQQRSADEGDLAALRQRLDGLERRLAALEESGRPDAEMPPERSDVPDHRRGRS